MAKRTNPYVQHGGIAIALVVGLTLALQLGFRLPWTWYHALACWLLAANIVAFGYYGYDKSQAIAAERRVPEAVLHGLVAGGGTLGAYAGMTLFRHKTIKPEFRIFFWFIVIIQVLMAAGVVYRLVRHG